jgi:hypothetical protein
MATNHAVSGLATTNLVIGGIAILGCIAIALGAALGRLPRNLPQLVMTRLEDAAFFAFLLGGPACLVAGVGLWKRRRWGRLVTLALGGLGGVLAVAGGVLAGLGVLGASGADDFLLPVCFATYCVAVFVTLWNETFAEGTL